MNFNDEDFKSLTQKYKDGSATEAERNYIATELEKNKLINDLLADELENDLFLDTEHFNNKSTDYLENALKESAQIKKTINRKFRRIIGISVIIVLSLIFTFNTFVSPIMKSMYYNPKAITQATYFDDFHYDLHTYTELNSPGYCSYRTTVEDLRFAKYNLNITQKNLFTGTLENTRIQLIKNKPIGIFDSFWIRDFLTFNSFNIHEHATFNKHLFDKSIASVKKMPQTSYISAFIGFKEPISLEDYFNLSIKYNDQVDFKWLAVQTSDSMKNPPHEIGFNPNFNDGPVAGDSPSQELYPFLQLVDMMDSKDEQNPPLSWDDYFIYGYETHFKSLLKYMIDREEFIHIFNFNPNTLDFYKSSLDYIENNGISIYGMLIYSDAQTLTEFITNEELLSFEIDNVKTSIYSKGTN